MEQVAGREGKILTPLLGVVAVFAMVAAGYSTVLSIQEREKRQVKERELHLAVAENDDLKGRLEETQSAKSKVEDELSRVRRELASSQEELAKAVEAQESLSRSIEDREREIGRLGKDLEQAKAESQKVVTQLADLQSEREALKKELVELEQAKGELETKVMELAERPTVELEKVMVGGEGGAPEGAGATVVNAMTTTGTAARDGRVMIINRDYDFIVMSLGKNHGVSVGQEFQVVRGDEVLGKVKVEQVYDDISAAALMPGSKKDAIRAGDSDGDQVKAL